MEVCAVSMPAGGAEELGARAKAPEGGFVAVLSAAVSAKGEGEAPAEGDSGLEAALVGEDSWDPEGFAVVTMPDAVGEAGMEREVLAADPKADTGAAEVDGELADGGFPLVPCAVGALPQGAPEAVSRDLPSQEAEGPGQDLDALTEVIPGTRRPHVAADPERSTGSAPSGPPRETRPPVGETEVAKGSLHMEPTVPEGVRDRAQESFRTRSERLWRHWLQERRGAAASTEGVVPGRQAPDPAAEGSLPPPAVAAMDQTPVAGDVTGTPLPLPAEDSVEPSRRGADEEGAEARPPLEATDRASESRSAEPVRAREVPRFKPPDPAHQVAREVRLAVARGGDRVTVRLEPESLGKVQVVLTREGGGITAHFRVENPQAHQALAGDAPMLRQVLEAKGVPLVQVSVELEDRGAGGRNPWGHSRGRSRRGGNGREGEAAEEVLLRTASWRPWGFDARI